jgi:hypothetical protein
MKFIQGLLRWGMLYLLVILMLGASFWVEDLNVLPVDHTILFIVILAIFFVLVNLWVTFHESNLLVSQSYLKQLEKKSEAPEISSKIESRWEKIKQ